jgi:hypothetical protein
LESKDLWTQKYAPTKMDDIIGNRGVIGSFEKWLEEWDDVVLKGNKNGYVKVRQAYE